MSTTEQLVQVRLTTHSSGRHQFFGASAGIVVGLVGVAQAVSNARWRH